MNTIVIDETREIGIPRLATNGLDTPSFWHQYEQNSETICYIYLSFSPPLPFYSTHTRAHAHTHARTHASTHKHTHKHTHTQTHAHTHTHTTHKYTN